ncbi:cbb3-type cytochrome c oxidase subunit I [Chitinophaga sp. B61]|uniref:Cbb3-type cytochrome c oxidase subunit I n=2 Tax=Chitinophaga rhizophila TaxID=2866212 RepID=A0ABS7GA53_9BACT|nr:cbb3-type cytochrome c oxidase subunit I [Chitinophaga rhizophila]
MRVLPVLLTVMPVPLLAATKGRAFFAIDAVEGWLFILLLLVIMILTTAIALKVRTGIIHTKSKRSDTAFEPTRFNEYISALNSKSIDTYLNLKKKQQRPTSGDLKGIGLLMIASLSSLPVASQQIDSSPSSLLQETGILITLVLLLIPVLAGLLLMAVKVAALVRRRNREQYLQQAAAFAHYLTTPDNPLIEEALQKRKRALAYQLHNKELAGDAPADDEKGLVGNINLHAGLSVVAQKQRAGRRPPVDPALSNLVMWYIGCAAFWLVVGTTVGEYVGIKFVSPDVDHVSWLSFGRLRPVHTNAVFWGWASLGMLGLGYYVVPRVSNVPLASLQQGWWALRLINTAVLLGSVSLMAGINNGGGEYREYIWPIQLLFGIGLLLTLSNFIRTIASRTTREIYISNWYIVAALMFALVISIVAYIPLWQDGLGETIIQGYYMHQGVGMWFMLFTLGIVYYFLPQQLNKPIYSYSLGILAFWAQILFYTLIGTHHFVFSAIPWWLQTVAIVGSVGMIIPVAAGTTNFFMTFRGGWHKLNNSYILPFFLVGVIFYFTGSLQGTAEAFRTTNLIWHFTDFTVAHSHLTMYGIVSFLLWAAIYAVVPRLSGKEAPQITVGAHFWLALIGLLFYTIPLMYGSTLRGIMWMQGKPFIDSVIMMAPYWLWRAIGGSLMWLSHLFFAYNLYKMMLGDDTADSRGAAVQRLNQSYSEIESTL